MAAYQLAVPMLDAGRVLDLGCGVGHSYRLLEPRETVGVDLSAEALEGQDRETVVADMRALPFAGASFASVLSVHSLEHVPDGGRVVAEAARVLIPDGKAVFVTPNRLTFGRPDEIIDLYHHVEYDAPQLEAVCAPFFEEVRVGGSSDPSATRCCSTSSEPSSTGCWPRTRCACAGWCPAGSSSCSTIAV
ncbi:MAG: class I SAM-dependent methyltransferase [Thermoleophilaceae bacterium]